MIENELKLLWQSTNEKLEDSLILNRNNAEDITRLKVHNFLSSTKPIKIFTLFAGIIWVVIVGTVLINLFINAYEKVSLFFLYSAAIQVILSAISIAIYVYQLILTYTIDYNEPIMVIQGQLSKLKRSTLTVTRILFLQLPVWTTFYWNETMFQNTSVFLWIIQGTITLLFTGCSLWLFLNIKYENRNKKWFQIIFSGSEWQPILHSMELLNTIENYQEEKN